MKYHQLCPLGWNTFFEDQLQSSIFCGPLIGRVAIENKTNYVVLCETGEYVAEATGRLFYMATSDAELPKVGDWVLMSETDANRAIIHQVLERKSVISRRAPGKKAEEQVLATNVDRLFIVQGLDDNFNLARLERYLTLAQNVEPVIVLNKADLCPDLPKVVARVKERIKNVPVLAVSATQSQLATRLEALTSFIASGTTIAFVGSSGVGKSTLINSLLQEERLATGATRATDSKGRHTTTRRELVVLPAGGILIDTPGMRELQLWGSEDQLEEAFEDIGAYIGRCKFGNCTHTDEPGCAVKAALGAGEISMAHWDNYLKMKRELVYLATKTDTQAMLEKKQKWKQIHKAQRNLYKNRD